MKKIILTIVVLLLAGCASGPAPRGVPINDIAQGQSRVLITRDNSFLYLALDTEIFVNGELIAALPKGGSTYHDLPPGRVTVKVSHPQTPGAYSVSFNLKNKQTAIVEVAPRSDSFAPFIFAGMIGSTIDASVNEQSGLFMIKNVTVKGVSKGNKQSVDNHSETTPQSPSGDDSSTSSGSLDEKLRALHKLYKDGVITQAEFDAKKSELLSKY